MKFSTREDIEAPIRDVFEMLSDFSVYERAAMRRGAEVRRTDRLAQPGVGATWQVQFKLRGKQRQLDLEVVKYAAPTDLVVSLTSKNITGQVTCELFALSRARTRIICAIEVKPLTLTARLLIQSLKLTKKSLDQKYKDRVAELITDMEDRYSRFA
jgi:hypothetical protein